MGLYDWRFEVMALVRHTNHLEACYNVGPHTISFPRIKNASALNINDTYFVSDEEFTRLIAILRLAVPYTGMILTARESEKLRDEIIQYGISQIGWWNKNRNRQLCRKRKNHNLNKGNLKLTTTALLMRLSTNCSIREMLPSSVPHAIG